MSVRKIILSSIILVYTAFAFAIDEVFLNGFSSRLIKLDGAVFSMGSDSFEKNEAPVHDVAVNSFYMLSTEVTQNDYESIVGLNYSHNKNPLKPVEEVSWYDAVVFCNLLSAAYGYEPCYSLMGKTDVLEWGVVPRVNDSEEMKAVWNSIECNFSAGGFRLPTEAEWEYAAKSASGEEKDSWNLSSSDGSTRTVRSGSSDSKGFYDLAGNVWEWCQDWYGWYDSSVLCNENDKDSSGRRIRRGGSYLSDASFCRAENRASSEPSLRGVDLGFRVVKSAADVTEDYLDSESEDIVTESSDAVVTDAAK